MTSSVDKSSPPESPTKAPVRSDNKETNLDIDDYFNVRPDSDVRKESLKAQAASNDLAELFESEEEDKNNLDKQPEIFNKPPQSEIISTVNQSPVEPNGSQKHDVENAYSKVKKTSPKNSPVDLYGCDEISTPVDENGHPIQLTSMLKFSNTLELMIFLLIIIKDIIFILYKENMTLFN